MPNRIIKDSINESAGLSNCSIFAQDLYKRLITYADDYGRFNADTVIMKARLYPRDYDIVTEQDIIDGLIELVGEHKIGFYSPSTFNQFGKRGIYGAFPNWESHQRMRDSKKKCPDPDNTEINDWYLRRFISMDLKRAVLERDGLKCTICGKYLTSCRDVNRFLKLGQGLYHIDHVVPVLQGGRATLENLRLTCPQCNLKRKRRFTFEEILQETLVNLDKSAVCGNSPQLAAICGGSRPESNPIQYESESNSNTPLTPQAGEGAPLIQQKFEQFWQEYPKKAAKQYALKAWMRIKPDKALFEKMLKALREQKQSEQWRRDNGKYIPNPATWLNGGYWDNEPEQPSRPGIQKQTSAHQYDERSGTDYSGVIIDLSAFDEKEEAKT